MTIEQLRILLELAKTHSMTLCASSLHISKSSISRAITQLESELSVQLFVKSHDGSFLTPAGEQVCNYAAQVIDGCNKIEHIGATANPQNSLTILYGNACLPLANSLVNTLRSKRNFGALHMTCTVQPHEGDTIATKHPDVVFGTLLKTELPEIAAYRDDHLAYSLFESPVCIITKSDNSISALQHKKAEIAGNKLKGLDIALYLADGPSQDELLINSGKLLQHWGVTNQVQVTYCDSISAIKSLLSKNYVVLTDGFGIKRSFGRELESGELEMLKIKPAESLIRYVLVLKDSPLFTDISEALAAMYYKPDSEFQQFKRLF